MNLKMMFMMTCTKVNLYQKTWVQLLIQCKQCGAMMWYDERIQKPYNPKKPRFSLCCMDGNIKNGKINTSMMFSFTSLGGKINTSMNDGNAPPMFIMNGENYHQMGSLLPQDGSQPKFAQLYIYDTNNEVANRMSVVGMDKDVSSLNSSIVEDIKQILDSCNPYAQAYRMVRDKLRTNDMPNLKLRILGKRGRDARRRYNIPTTSEAAALIVGDYDAADYEKGHNYRAENSTQRRNKSFNNMKEDYITVNYLVDGMPRV
ncbi:AT hook motif protein, putative [Medicago truncatula]|uniref:AT hook motif protein, putative n=1 Tax=Medicago truncatula TaxID=3880 RepID=A0A072TPL0_MEDTR|nr:AT hook motif protein, putative [Medicago truncatula]